MPILEVKNVCKVFGKKDAAVHALNGVSIAVEPGESVAIMGKSGSGKSTLLNILGGLMSMTSGEFFYNDQPFDSSQRKNLIRYRRDEVGFIVQYFALVSDMTVFDNVALPLRYRNMNRKKIREKVMATLESLEIPDKAKAYPDELSGGQQQRVSIARALVKEPKIILADEPTGALDVQTEESVLSILKALNRKEKTIIMVTHDRNVAEICSRVIHLSDGLLSDTGI
jgi:putative ABC transport system ATP-binding protein